jgi:hypothetical protein
MTCALTLDLGGAPQKGSVTTNIEERLAGW